jgi:hypothetical protein
MHSILQLVQEQVHAWIIVYRPEGRLVSMSHLVWIEQYNRCMMHL